MNSTKQQPTELEWEILQFIWQARKQVTVREILESAYPDGQKAYTTVQTVMNNLVGKGYLNKEKVGLVNFYRPSEARDTTLRSAVTQMAKRFFGGSVNDLANFLVDSDSLNEEELIRLKALLEQKQKKESNNE
ncbi:MAG: BlaI/MecI/CopY family transcriptional regulator [Calditrichia bacterium]